MAEIYVRLLDEGSEAWRPVKAKKISTNVFEIVEQAYDRDDEKWEFEPGDKVVVVETKDADFQSFLSAIKRSEQSK